MKKAYVVTKTVPWDVESGDTVVKVFTGKGMKQRAAAFVDHWNALYDGSKNDWRYSAHSFPLEGA